MGLIWSKRQQHGHHHHHHHHHHPHPHPHHHHLHRPQPYPPPPPPPPSTSTPAPPLPPSYAFAANAPHPSLPPPPAYAPQTYSGTSSSYYNTTSNYNYNYGNFARPVNMIGPPQPNYHNPYYVGHGNGWFRPPPAVILPPPVPLPLPAPAPYVDHQSAKKIKNDVNVHKDTIRLEVDENRDCHLVSFTFDALVDGSITIFYFAKEGDHCTFNPMYPDIYVPVKIPFQKGLGQKFCQPTGSGIDFGFFEVDDLSKPAGGDVFPLVISAESSLSSAVMHEESNDELLNQSVHAQITQAVIEKNNEDQFHVKVVKQILWVDGVRYELREIYGISDSNEIINDKDSGKECVICMTEPKDTAVLPCRHMCMCSECAKELRLQSNKCPICRQPIEELLEIKVDEASS